MDKGGKFLKKLWCCLGGKVYAERWTEGQRSKRQSFNSLRWPIYVLNSVDHVKLPYKIVDS